MYASKHDQSIYGYNIPLYQVLYIKKTLKKVDEMVKKEIKRQNRKKNVLDNKIYDNGVQNVKFNLD